MEYMRLTWEDIEQLVSKICDDIKKRYTPNHIISIGRGGMIVSRLISDKLNIKDISLINVKLYKNVGEKNDKIEIKNYSEFIEKKNVLLVDDISDSGETIEKVIDYLKDRRTNVLRTAVLLIRDSLVRSPSFIGKIIKKEWVIFPWEKEEFKDCKNNNDEKNKEMNDTTEQKLLTDEEIDKILDEE